LGLMDIKMNSIILKVGITLLCTLATTFTFAEESAEKWLFVHTAEYAQVTNSTTIVMPVTRDVFAFTDRPIRHHAYLTGEKLASLWADTSNNSFKTDPPNAVLTWVDGENVNEAEVVITGATSEDESITYTIVIDANTVPNTELKYVSLFIDDVNISICSNHSNCFF